MLVILPDVFDCKTLILEVQQSLDAWAHRLNATGGVLNSLSAMDACDHPLLS